MAETYILEGTIPVPVDLQTWARWFATAERHVAETWVTPEVRVSTVFLGLDHQYGAGPPLLFETMVFRDGDGCEQERYGTWQAAEQGHQAMVAQLREALHIP